MIRATTSEEEQLILERYKKYHPPTFSGLAKDDAQGFLEECHRILRSMGIVETSEVDFVMFQLRGAAYQWWRAYELGSPDEEASLSWVQFSEMFLREFVPQSLRDAWCAEFEKLRQGTMLVSEYAVRFSDLARHAPALVATVKERVRIAKQVDQYIAARIVAVETQVWVRLKDPKPALKTLNSKEFRGITQKIEKARIELSDIQGKISQGCTDALLDMEKKVLLNLKKWSLIEESVLQQKARAKWIQLGDSNSKYFTAVMKERTQKNCQYLACHQHNVHEEWSYTISPTKVDLCAEVTNQEIVESLKAIGDDKAQDIDGFNAVFFKKAWDIINIQIIDAVKEFFSIGKLYKAINCTTVTLVPKVNKPTTVKEYRPIACCSILYKIISKILASRLQKVMPYIICEAQAGFIPGRKIANNAILAHELVKSYTRSQISPRCMIKIDLQKAYDSVE
ncbi:uncharacterized protein [Nicotiana tomentosiformis]|uniref:uncharacterized protein n=1 Tax=Nicotiana tomentosiformis TaxID=4098 RepID=UPI00388C54F5